MIFTALRAGRFRGITAVFACLGLIVSATGREPTEGRQAMVVSGHRLASEVGKSVMLKGGNAIDGAVATGFALAVVLPRTGNLGGGGFMMIRTANGREVAIDYREVAPSAATRDMFLDEAGEAVALRTRQGYLANGVPGTVAGLEHAWKNYGSGKISWHDIIEPSRKLAAEGFVISAALAQHLKAHAHRLSGNAESKRIFLRDGDLHQAGERLVQPDLASTLTRIQTKGAQEFYVGETARLIAADQQRGGGLITLADLAAYRPIEREPIRGTYRGYEFITMPPPSSGGIALKQILGMLESHDLRELRLHSASYIHLVSEAMRRAFYDRARHLGDPDFHEVPQARLTAPDYIENLLADFDPAGATPSDQLSPDGLELPGSESPETTHFAAMDAAGNVATSTYTLNGNYGNSVTVAGAGFLLNNEMDDFTAKVGVENMFGLMQSVANAVEAGKRPLSSMTPTIVLRNGKPFLTTGAPGGPTIITTVLQVMLNVIDFDLPLTVAVDAPRFHHQWQPDRIAHEPFFASPDTIESLRDMGHNFALRRLYSFESNRMARYFGDAESIMVDPDTGWLLGVSDRRNPDAAPAGF